jgi:hypothetical protein
MIDFIKRMATYVAGAVTFFIALAFAFGFALQLTILLISGGAIICAVFAWIETFPKGFRLSSSQHEADVEASISLSISHAMDRTRFAERDDESIAGEANKIVRRGLDKHCIKYSDYKLWRQKNPIIFSAVTDEENRLIGFFDVWPLTEKAAAGLISGKLKEGDLVIGDIAPFEQNAAAQRIYLASIMANPKQKSYSPVVAKEVLLLKFAEFLASTFPPNGERTLFAFGHTLAGETLLKRARFTNTALSEDTRQKDPLYQLSENGYSDLVATLQRLKYVKH